jgi:hypothetical protein
MITEQDLSTRGKTPPPHVKFQVSSFKFQIYLLQPQEDCKQKKKRYSTHSRTPIIQNETNQASSFYRQGASFTSNLVKISSEVQPLFAKNARETSRPVVSYTKIYLNSL